MVYLGGVWPDEYHNQLFMNNIHGSRLNMDRLFRQESGYYGDAAPDFLFANDAWSQILYMTYGPDGQVYMIDWYDQNQCHHGRTPDHDRRNGRIFKISFDDGTAPRRTPNRWMSPGCRMPNWSRCKRMPTSGIRDTHGASSPNEKPRDRWIRERSRWCQSGCTTRPIRTAVAVPVGIACRRGNDPETLLRLTHHADTDVRAWSVQLACEQGAPEPPWWNGLRKWPEVPSRRPSGCIWRPPCSDCRWRIAGGSLEGS